MNRLLHVSPLIFLLVSFGCSGSSTSSSPLGGSSGTLSGTVTDAIGDATVTAVIRNGVTLTPLVAVRPDLTAATIEVSGGNLTATVSFATGTLSHADTIFCVLLDTDENPGTGTPGGGADSAVFAWDYSICAVNPRGSSLAQVSHATSAAEGIATGTVPMTFPSADQGRFTVPLSMLGNDDGRMSFKVKALQWVDAPIVNTDLIDAMPDVGRPAGLVR